MARWMTTAEISARYIVGEQKLLAYAQRGNMPMLRGPDGTTLFDESFAAQLFRPRTQPVAQVTTPPGRPSLGTLGVTRLGEPRGEPGTPATTHVPPSLTSMPERSGSLRRAHRRALHDVTTAEQAKRRMRAATG